MSKVIITSHKIKSGKLFIDAKDELAILEEFEISKEAFEEWLTGGKGSYEWTMINRQSDIEIEGQSTLDEYWADCNDIDLHLTEYINTDCVESARVKKWMAKYTLLQTLSLVPEEYKQLIELSAEHYANMSSNYASVYSAHRSLFKNNLVIVEQLKKIA